MNRPSSVLDALEQVLVCAIITRDKHKVPLPAGGEESLERFALIRPYRPYLNRSVTTESSLFRVRKHGFEHRGQFVRQPTAEFRLGHVVVPN